jgi:ABC-2 type transport system ATP-binding protein
MVSGSELGGRSLRDDDVLVHTEGLTKRFGSRLAVAGVDLEVRRGDVFGLLGPNGSGKTTTLRLLLGLVLPSGGRITLFGRDVTRTGWRRAALRRVGALVERPAFYPFLSGRENLAGVATFGGLPFGPDTRARIERALTQVRLAPRADDAFHKYSLGMKQRLGIAAALLTDPELVLLDEPTNGLDPAGMVEVRTLIGQLAERGTTVLLSSHLLYEVQQVCTRVAILKDGALLAQGLVSELLSGGGGVQIAFTNPEDLTRAIAVLQAAQANGAAWLGGARYIGAEPGSGSSPPGGSSLLVRAPVERAAEINQLLASQGIYVAELRRRAASLEQFFLTLTGAQTTSATPPSTIEVPRSAPVSAGSSGEEAI